MASELTINEVKDRRLKTAVLRLQAIFYFVSALSSAGYIAYVIIFYDIYARATGDKTHFTALVILSGSLFLEALLEIPTGAFADRYGYHKAVKLGFAALFFHALFYLIAAFRLQDQGTGNHPLIFSLLIIGEALAALGLALQNGSLNSWFVRNIRREGYGKELTPFMSRKRLATNLSWLIVGLFAIVLRSQGSLTGPFLIGVISYLVAFFVTLKLITGSRSEKKPERFSLRFFIRLTKDEFYGALGGILENRKLLVVAIAHAIFWTLGIIITYSWRQILEIKEQSETFFLRYAGIVWLIYSVGRILGNHIASRIKVHEAHKRDNRVSFFNLGQFLMAVPLLFMILVVKTANSTPLYMIVAILLAISRVGQELSKPITMAWTHEEIRTERYRATIDSLIEASTGFVIVLVMLILVFISKTSSPGTDNTNIIKNIVIMLSLTIIIINIPLAWFAMRKRSKFIKEAESEK
jgi:hypothetical protein